MSLRVRAAVVQELGSGFLGSISSGSRYELMRPTLRSVEDRHGFHVDHARLNCYGYVPAAADRGAVGAPADERDRLSRCRRESSLGRLREAASDFGRWRVTCAL